MAKDKKDDYVDDRSEGHRLGQWHMDMQEAEAAERREQGAANSVARQQQQHNAKKGNMKRRGKARK